MNSITMSARFRASVLAMFAFALFAFATSASAATNLVANPNFDSSSTSTGIADHWNIGGYDNNGNFATYTTHSIIAGSTGGADKAAQVSVNNAAFSGDIKWVFDATSTTPGALYTFSDLYKSDTNSYLVAAFTYSDGSTNHFMQLAILSNTGGAWKTATADFSVPKPDASEAQPVSMTVYHLIKGVGTLATDNYSLSSFENTTGDLFSKPIVSLTFDDGWTSQYDEGFQMLKTNNLTGSFFIISNPMIAASYDFFTDPNQSIVPTSAAKSMSWGPIYTDPTNTKHRFADTYTATAASTVVATYLLNGVPATTTIGTLPAATNGRASLVFDLPTNTGNTTVTPITITHSVTTGTLTASNPSLTEYGSGYMSADQLKDLKAANNEIAAHTVSHCSLLTLTACAFPTLAFDAATEIASSSAQIISKVGGTIATLAYPYGDYNGAIEVAAQTGNFTPETKLVGARSVDYGYNRLTTDKFALKSQSVNASTTVAEVQSWIDTAIAHNFWLVLTFHQVDSPDVIRANGEDTGTTPEKLSAILAYIKLKKDSGALDVQTLKDGLATMAGTPITPADTTAPVITLTGSASTSVTVGTAYTDAGATATDNVDPSVSVVTTVTIGAVATTSVNTNVVGTYIVHYNAHDVAGNNAAEVTRTVNVTAAPVVIPPAPVLIEITPATISNGITGIAYSQVLAASTTLSGPFSWVIKSGMLPVGLTLGTGSASTIVISGTPTAATSSNFTIEVDNGTATTTKLFTLVIADPAPVTPPSTPAPATGNGGGGGGGGVVGNGSLSLGYVYVNPAGPITTTPGSVLGAATCFVFTKNLTVGSTGAEVTALQNRLAVEGLFSAGTTGYFGTVTRASVMAFQKKNGIEQLGNTGPKTRAALNVCATAPAAPATGAGSVLGSSTVTFTQNLSLGSTGEEVNALQKILIDLGFLKVLAPTGYFGALTKVGVSDYQTSRGIEAIGSVGPKTRAALNSNAPALKQEVLSSEK